MIAATDPILEAVALSVDFQRGAARHAALLDVSLTLHRGEAVAVVGESGSGKSSLALAAAGLLASGLPGPGLLRSGGGPRVRGSLRVHGTQIVGAPESVLRHVRRAHVGIVFQDPMTALNPTMRIGRQIAEALPRDQRSGTQAAGDWLARVGIRAGAARSGAFPHQLSGGERQRVMIAIAMASRPALLVADEPTTALDVTVQAQILGLLRDVRRDHGTALLFVTHDLDVAATVAERMIVLYAGRIVEAGATADILRNPAHPYTAALIAARFGLQADRSRPLPAPVVPMSAPDPTTSGCGFAPRCALADATCAVRPALMAFGGMDRQVACWRPGEADGKRQTPIARMAAPTPVAQPGVVLELVGVRKAYYSRRPAPWQQRPCTVALAPFDLCLAANEAVALVGESGSGKSTVLRIAAGLVAADGGDVFYAGPGRPQMVFQDAVASLTPWLTVGEMVGERLRRTMPDRRRRLAQIGSILGRVGLDPSLVSCRPAELSGGQCQRVAIARAIAVPPRLLLCDEPITAVDVSLAAGLLNLIGALRREFGMAILFVTHDVAAARYVADRMIVLRRGVVMEHGTSEDVVAQPRSSYTRQLIDALPQRLAGAA